MSCESCTSSVEEAASFVTCFIFGNMHVVCPHPAFVCSWLNKRRHVRLSRSDWGLGSGVTIFRTGYEANFIKYVLI